MTKTQSYLTGKPDSHRLKTLGGCWDGGFKALLERSPPGPLFLHDDVSEGVVLFGQTVSDGLLTPKRQGPLP